MRQAIDKALVERYVPFVRRAAQHLKQRMPRADRDDLEQAGMVGLIECVARFRAENAATFETFIGHRVRGAMLDSVRKADWAPRSVNRAARDIAKAIHAIEVAESRPAREVEIAERLGLSLDDYHRALTDTATRHILSIDEAPAAQHVESLCPRPDDEVAQARLDSDLSLAIAALPERERMIIEATFFDGEMLHEVGARMGVCESRVCQLRASAVARLRARLMPSELA